MTRPALPRVAACLAAVLVTAVLAPVAPSAAAAARAAQAPVDTPLEVSIDALSPSTIPSRGTIAVTGQVTNRSDSTWTDLNVYLLTSASPLTTSEQLAEANDTAPELEVGARLTEPTLFVSVGDLPPGSSTSYRLEVPASALQITGEDGVYWLGVHVLGANELGRDSTADGRARTYIPLMGRDAPTTTLSLVFPVKGQVRRGADGRLAGLEHWQRTFGEEGRLGRLLDLAGSSTSVPVTWLVDPAVLDAARSIANDNPPISTAPTAEEAPSTDQSADPGAGATASPDPTGTPTELPGGGTDEEPPDGRSAQAEVALRWLTTFVQQSGRHAVLTVPYGDADIAAMLRAGLPGVYERVKRLSVLTMDELGVQAVPVVAPANGLLPNAALEKLNPDRRILLTDEAAPDATSTVIRSGRGHKIVLSRSAVRSGGPAPTPPFKALAMRQRVLAEAAVHALTGPADGPLVVAMPEFWNPGSDWRGSDFLRGLDVPWLGAASVPVATAGLPRTGDSPSGFDGVLHYTRADAAKELPVANLLATHELGQTGSLFADLLTRNDDVDEQLAEIAALTSSIRSRTRPDRAVLRCLAASQRVHSLLDKVRIEGPAFVTMSSEQGTLQVTIVNDLDEPVTVGIKASTGTPDLVIPSPEPVSLGAGQRASVRLSATSRNIGVHSVTLVPTTGDGRPLGGSTKVNVRSSQVGLVIWVIMSTGAVVLLVAAAVRVARRVRRRKATHGPLLGHARR